MNPKGKYNLNFIDWQNEFDQVYGGSDDDDDSDSDSSPIQGMDRETFQAILDEEKEFDKFQLIRNLLYKKKFTIAGAKIELKETLSKSKKIIPSKTTVLTLEEDVNKILDDAKSLEQKFKPATSKSLTKQLSQLKLQLVKLKELL